MVIPEKDREKARRFCLECIKRNTPIGSWHGSSPEDVATTCEGLAERMYGRPMQGMWLEKAKGYGDGMVFVPIEDSPVVAK